jgi:hypothetical protein
MQSSEVWTTRKGVTGVQLGLMPDYTNYSGIAKG